MARLYTIQPAHRATLSAAIRLTKKKAKAATGTNSSLELTQGEAEAQELAGYCEEIEMVIDRATGDKMEFTNGQVNAARSALRVYGGTLKRKEDEIGDLLGSDRSEGVSELADEEKVVAQLLRTLSPQGELPMDEATADAFPANDAAATDAPKEKKAKKPKRSKSKALQLVRDHEGDGGGADSDDFDYAEEDDAPYAPPLALAAGDVSGDAVAEADYEIVDDHTPDASGIVVDDDDVMPWDVPLEDAEREATVSEETAEEE